MGRIIDLLLATRGEGTGSLSSQLGRWRLAVSTALGLQAESGGVTLVTPQVGRGATAPLAYETGPSIGFSMAVDSLLYGAEALHPARDPAQPVIIELRWIGTTSEADKVVTWQLDVNIVKDGVLTSTVSFTGTALEEPVPAVADTYAVTEFTIPAATIAAVAGADELHMRATRAATEIGSPSTAPALCYFKVRQFLLAS